MDRCSFAARLQYLLLGLTLTLAVSCKSTGSYQGSSSSDSKYADTDQNKLRWEYKRRELEVKKHNREVTRMAKAGSSRRSGRYAKTKVDRNVQKVIQTARSYRGTPYRYGGTTRIGMDCSGLLCTSFKAVDVILPRTSNEQSEFGDKVRTKEIRPGDLVFFSESQFSSRISHVGLVTEVKGPTEVFFIHASTSLGVMEDNLFSNHYQKIFLKAVRPKM